MTRIVLLVPPNREGYVRDTYYGCWHRKKFVNYSWPPLMLYYLHTLLPDSVVLDAPAHNLSQEEALLKIADLDADTVVTSTGTFTVQEDGPFLAKLRKEFGCTTALYGEFATTNPQAALQLGHFVIKGEPEAALPALMKQLRHHSPRTVIDAGLVKDLDALPFPRRVLEDRQLYFNPFAKTGPFTTVLASRGCPFECIFCSVPVMYGRSVRVRSPKNVLEELTLLEEQGFREVFFRDENLTLHKGFLTELCNGMIERGLELRWIANSRVDTVDEQLLSLMRKAGCHLLKFGVESFSNKTLKTLKKGTDNRQVRKAFSLCEGTGISTVAHMMLGCPGESEGQIRGNIKELVKLNPTYASFDVVLTYPGTGLAQMQEEGKTTEIPHERLEKLHDYAFRRFYLRPRLLRKHISAIGSGEELLWKAKTTVQLWKGLLKRG